MAPREVPKKTLANGDPGTLWHMYENASVLNEGFKRVPERIDRGFQALEFSPSVPAEVPQSQFQEGHL
jgi:hypothetical protein